MHGHLLQLISRRLRGCASQLTPFTRFSSARKEPVTENFKESVTENFSVISRQRIQIPTPPSCEQNPSDSFATAPFLGPPSNPSLDLASSPRHDSNTSPHSDASIPEVNAIIWAVERLSKGKIYTQLAREQERVPGFVLDQESPGDKHVLILMDKYQIQSLWGVLGQERFLSTVFTLEIFDGIGSNNVLYQERVLPRRINFDKDGKIANVGFLKAPLGIKLRLDVPIRIFGLDDCRGVKKGGSLIVHLSYASFLCLPEEVPPFVEIHVNGLDIGESICLGDLKIGLELHSNNQPSSPICEIVQARTEL